MPVVAVMTMSSAAHKLPLDACAVLPVAQINSILGTHLRNAEATNHGQSCFYQSADAKMKVTIEWIRMRDPADAARFLKKYSEDVASRIRKGEKLIDVFSQFMPFPEAGANAFVLAGTGSDRRFVRLETALGAHIVVLDTEGIDHDQVIAKLGQIYRAMKSNEGM